MNTFNRVVMTLLLLATIIVMTVALVVPRLTIEFLQERLWNLDLNLALVDPLILLVGGVALALLVDVVCAVLIWFEVRRRRYPRAIRVQSVTGGEAELAVESIASRLERRISRLDGVLSVQSDIRGKRGGVEVELALETAADVDVPTKTEEVCQVTREAIEDNMGLKLRKVRVNIKYADYSAAPPIVPQYTPDLAEPPMVSGHIPDLTEPPMVSGGPDLTEPPAAYEDS